MAHHEGTNANSSTFALPQGTSAAGKPFWSGDATKGFKYKDAKGEQGPVSGVTIKKTGSGTFQIGAKLKGRFAPLSVVPANPSVGSCVWLELAGGGSYSVMFADGELDENGALSYSQKKVNLTGSCAPSCDDDLPNGDESDNDCGGTVCFPCGNGATCNSNSDCVGNLCDEGVCGEIVAVCGNGAHEPGEFCDDGNLIPCDGCSPNCFDEASLTATTGPDLGLGIADDSYDGTIGSMACAQINVAATGDALVDYVCPVLSMDHSWLGDLVIKVVHPDNTVVTLMSQAGFAEVADNGVSTGGDSSNLSALAPITWKDSGPKSAEDMGNTLINDEVVCQDDSQCVYAPNPGAAAPGTLANFIGKTAPGIWRFCVGDTNLNDTGTIEKADLVIGQ